MNHNIYNAEIKRIMCLKLLTSIFIISHDEKYKIILQAGNVMLDNVEFINLRQTNILERYGKFKVRCEIQVSLTSLFKLDIKALKDKRFIT